MFKIALSLLLVVGAAQAHITEPIGTLVRIWETAPNLGDSGLCLRFVVSLFINEPRSAKMNSDWNPNLASYDSSLRRRFEPRSSSEVDSSDARFNPPAWSGSRSSAFDRMRLC